GSIHFIHEQVGRAEPGRARPVQVGGVVVSFASLDRTASGGSRKLVSRKRRIKLFHHRDRESHRNSMIKCSLSSVRATSLQHAIIWFQTDVVFSAPLCLCGEKGSEVSDFPW